MLACVTGATGFVGGHVAAQLAERGDRVRVTFRDERRLGRLSELGVEPVKADVLDLNVGVICDSKSGVSGAGRKGEINLLFSEASDNFAAYNVAGHRHLHVVELRRLRQ